MFKLDQREAKPVITLPSASFVVKFDLYIWLRKRERVILWRNVVGLPEEKVKL